MNKKPDDRPPLDRWRADQVLEPNRPIWGLRAIAKFLCLSEDTVRRMAKKPEVPISRPEGGGTYFAFRSDLIDWLKRKAP